jgi:Acetyltransferase (GNAT) domain
MTNRNMPNLVIEKINLERVGDFRDALIESGKEWFAVGMIPKPDLSIGELEFMAKDFLELWEKDNAYMFLILDAATDQVVGSIFLNHVNRQYEMANLGYMVRASRMGEGIATEAAKLVARYGFEKCREIRSNQGRTSPQSFATARLSMRCLLVFPYSDGLWH